MTSTTALTPELAYSQQIKQARLSLGQSIAKISETMADLGYNMAVSYLESMEYTPRALRAPGRIRLEQIAHAFQTIATEQGKDPGEYTVTVLFPYYFPAK